MNKRDISTPRTAQDVQRRVGSVKNKVDKVSGQGLSDNNFTNKYKNDIENNTKERHSHSNMSILNTITEEKVKKINSLLNEINKVELFNGNDLEAPLSDNPNNYDMIAINYGNGDCYDTKILCDINYTSFYISLDIDSKTIEKSLCTISEDILNSESINILSVIGFKFRKGDN